MTGRIRWDESNDTVPGYGTVFGWRGYVGSGDLYLFLVTKRSLDGDDYALVTELPWLDKKRSCDPDPDELKAEAERWLEEFVSSLGAVFPDEPDESAAFLTREARAVLARWDAEGDIAIGREKVLADQVRALLAIVDQVAASPAQDIDPNAL